LAAVDFESVGRHGQACLKLKSPNHGRDSKVISAAIAVPVEGAWQMAGETGAAGEIFIVDDDPAIHTALSMVFSREGYQVTSFFDGASLLSATRSRTPVCVVLDVHIPGRSGLDILRELNAQNYPAPIFIMSGQGDIPMAVEAIRYGALDFIEKPFRGSEIVTRVREAIEALKRRRVDEKASDTFKFHVPEGREPLTPRESEVLALFVAGASNKEAGRQLGISPRTIEVHRARIMEKLGAKNIADVIRIVMSQKPST
jgi:FixJ family two-component response regulator